VSRQVDQFTHGPWELDDHIHATGTVWGPDGMAVCTVTNRGGELVYNARLISAAPDLLTQLRIARTWLRNSGFGNTGIMLGINAAIEKAAG